MADKALRGHGLGSKSLADSSGVELAARRDLEFVCPNDHHFTRTFAEEAELRSVGVPVDKFQNAGDGDPADAGNALSLDASIGNRDMWIEA